MKGFRELLVFGSCLVVAIALAPAAEPAITNVQVGFQGHVKHGHWSEVQATIQGGDRAFRARLKVDSRDGDGVAVTYVGKEVEIEAGQETQLRVSIKVGPPESEVQVRLCDEGEQTLATASIPAAEMHPHISTSYLYASLGASLEVGNATEPLRRSGAEEVSNVALTDWHDLPQTPFGYGGLDALVLVAGHHNPLTDTDPATRDALLEWIGLGGHAVVICGSTAPELLEAGGACGKLSPGEFVGRSPLQSDAGLRIVGGESLGLDPSLEVAVFEVSPKEVALGETGTGTERPLIIERPLGMGRITYFTLDLSKPPLANWAGRGKLLARLLSGESITSERTESVRTAGGRMTHLGYRDLSGQLRSGLEQYEAVSTVHFYSIAGLLLLYLLLLGPGEYFLLRRAAPAAMHLTWLLLPSLVAGFAVGAYALGRSSRGEQLRINQLELVDIDAAQGRQRGAMWLGMFSPEAAAYEVAMRPGVPIQKSQVDGSQLSWQALPGKSLGGVDHRPLASAFKDSYEIHLAADQELAVTRGLPLATGSTKLLTGSWWGTVAPIPQASKLKKGRLVDLEGSFTNVAPVTLSNAYLAHGEWLYRARDEIEPGANVFVDQMDRRYLETLPQRRVTSSDLAAPWNQEEMEVPRILEVMMFHNAVRGRSYTVLTHRYQPELDLSLLLKRGYAVLVGRSPSPITNTNIDGQPIPSDSVRRWTFYRIIYPVAEFQGDAPAHKP